MKYRIVIGSLIGFTAIAAVQAQTLSPDEARAIAKDAYIYGFPLVDNYRIQYSYLKGTWKFPEAEPQ